MFLANISVYTSLSRAHLLDKRSKVVEGGEIRKKARERKRERER